MLNPNTACDPRTRIGRLIRFGCSTIRSIASFFDFGSGRVLKTGLLVLTKSRKRFASTWRSRKARSGGSLWMSRSAISIPRSSRNLLAFRHVVQVGFQKKIAFAMVAIVDRVRRRPAAAARLRGAALPVLYNGPWKRPC